MKQFVVGLLAPLLILMVAISASAGNGRPNAVHLGRAKACIVAARRDEALAMKYIHEAIKGNGLPKAVIVSKVLEPAVAKLKCAHAEMLAANNAGEISVDDDGHVSGDINHALVWDEGAVKDLPEIGPNIRQVQYLEQAELWKERALEDLEAAIAPPKTKPKPRPKTPTTTAPDTPAPAPVPATFTIGLVHVFGAGPSSTNDCEQVTVNETGMDLDPNDATLAVTGPGGFAKTNTLVFSRTGPGVYAAAPSVFLFSEFGSYSENAAVTVNGTTLHQTGSFALDASNDTTTGGCPPP